MVLETTCPNCHQKVPGRVDLITPHSPESRDDQVALIHQERRRLDRMIAQLNEERAELLRKLNAIQSRTAVLPVETLSSIFEHACPPPPDFTSRYTYFSFLCGRASPQYPQFTLGAVSSHWHKVVLSTPRLWTWVILNIYPGSGRKKAGNVEKRGAFLRHFIENSKKVPFTLALYFSKDIEPTSRHLVHEVVDNLLIEAMPRIQELRLINPPDQWQTYTTHLFQLRDFTLSFDRTEDPTIKSFVKFPSSAPLRRLSISEALWLSDANTQPPWTTLTLLHLTSVPPDSSVQVFVQCPNLVKFHCSRPLEQPLRLGQVTLTRPISFQRLVSFHWETKDCPWSRALIRYLHVPALEDMHWDTFDAGSDNNEDIRAFFGRLPSTFKTLTLDATASNLEYIRNDSNTGSLELLACTTSELRVLLHKLRPNQQGGRTVKPLPRLEKVRLAEGLYDEDTLEHVDTLPTSYSTTLVEMLEQRLDESNPSFTLNIETTIFQWTSEAHTKLSELIGRGYKVNITERFTGEV